MKTIKQLYDDLINNIDDIYPSTTLILGINNKQRFVSCQSLLDYIERKYLKSSKPSLNNDFKKVCPECKWVIDESNENIEYDKLGMPYCLKCGKPIPKS